MVWHNFAKKDASFPSARGIGHHHALVRAMQAVQLGEDLDLELGEGLEFNILKRRSGWHNFPGMIRSFLNFKQLK
jgi:hypothetical protein